MGERIGARNSGPSARRLTFRRHPVEPTDGHLEAGVELVQMPTQPLLCSCPFSNEAITVIHEQLQLRAPHARGRRPAGITLTRRPSNPYGIAEELGQLAGVAVHRDRFA